MQSAAEIMETWWQKEQAKKHAKADLKRDQLRRKYLKEKYGLTPEQVLDMLKVQGFKCPICDLPIGPELDRDTQVEHCHKTKRIRGVVCLRCNLAIGWIQDNPDRAKRIIDYLEHR